MALLTAEDVLNKAFSKTKYREGFDQDEVDDFLDEVANTIAQLTAERDDLAARLGNGGAPAIPAAEAPPLTEAGGVPGTTGLLAAATEPGGANPTGMLAMAQKLHDEYVQAGEAERDRIIDEAHVAADQIRDRADADAQTRMDDLAAERSGIEARIDDLRRFERDYRARLKTFLENLLGDLDHTGAGVGLAAAGLAEDFPAGDASADDAPAQAEAFLVEEVRVTDVYESEDGETEVVIVDEYEQVTPVSFDEAVQYQTDWSQPAAEGAEESAEGAEGAESTEATESSESTEPAESTESTDEVAPAVPTYDVSQSWESQLRPQSSPFAPVSQPEQAPAEGEGDAKDVLAPSEQEDAPYTPPSSRMFNNLYGQQRPESEN